MAFQLRFLLAIWILLWALPGCPSGDPPPADDDALDDDDADDDTGDDDDSTEEVAVPEGGMDPGVPGVLVGMRAHTEVDGELLTSAPVEVTLLEPAAGARSMDDGGRPGRTSEEAVAIELRERLVQGVGP